MEIFRMRNHLNSKLLKSLSLFLIILVFSTLIVSVDGVNTFILNDFSDFTQISDSSNFASINTVGGISFNLDDNSTLDNKSEMHRFNLTQHFYDFNFSIGFICNRDKPLDIQFRIILESEYDENGTYLEGNFSRICATSLIGFTGEFRDLLYRVEFYPNGTYTKSQSAVFISYFLTSEFFFSRLNGNVKCMIKDGMGGYFHEKFTANHDTGLNRSLDAISIELVMSSLQCNPFTIEVNSINGELYDFVRENPETAGPTTTPEITFDVSNSSIFMIISTLIIISFYIHKRKESS